MKEFDRFMEVMRKVKTECPWDKQQTHQTLRQYFIEETYEVIDTIDEMNYPEMEEELGDVLTQIAFHALLAEDKKKFKIEDVCNTVSEKLIRRHPHIFSDVEVKDEHDVLKNWENIKLKEGNKESILDGVPKHLPALIKAYRVQSKAGRVGFDWEDYGGAFAKLYEELDELKESVESEDKNRIEEELGDLLFAIANLSRKLEINPEDALRGTIAKFDRRFKYIEKSIAGQGKIMKDTTLEEMDKLWEEAKNKV